MSSQTQKPKLLDFFTGKAKTKRIVYYSTDKQRYTSAEVPRHMTILSKSDLNLDSTSIDSTPSDVSSIYTPSVSSGDSNSFSTSGGSDNLSDIINRYTDDISERETDDTQSQKSTGSIRTIDTNVSRSSNSSASDSFFKN